MGWLIWKDYRLNRLLVVVALVVMVVPYVAVAIGSAEYAGTERFYEDLAGGSCLGLGALQVLLAFVGGNVIAGERADRSAEFLAALPIPRWRSLVSKLLVSFGLAAVVWIPNLIAMGLVWRSLQPTAAASVTAALAGIAATGLAFFGVGWFFSAISQSATLAILAGILSPAAVFMLVWSVLVFLARYAHWGYVELDRRLVFGYQLVCVVCAAVAFVAGTLSYLRRVEP